MADVESSIGGRVSEDFKVKSGGARMAASTGRNTRHYGAEELRHIGSICGQRLPPASAVQAMFQYELHRQSEAESLFQGTMFQLAQAEDQSKDHETRIARLEGQLKVVQRQLQVKDVEERLATSKLRMNQQQTKLDECAAKLRANEKLLEAFSHKMAEWTQAKAAGEQPKTATKELLEEVTGIKDDVDELYNEKEAMCTLLEDGGTRITKLEDLVRSLTLQWSTSTSPSNAGSPSMTQRLPLQTANGQFVDLLVPRGSGMGNGRENRGPPKSFTPGEQWTG
ncbi:hypothetical protein LTR36_002094 [Oleoguttula mirabilis]|uniref:Uncharacterized protein n=1 Tax=Oleoguttula mirabilis TaxID=1507867 RepID=A0AAV9JM81_9PEZI|nr:hypothetical protein LTR36_002094 [Oleoguttula mirabilis]